MKNKIIICINVILTLAVVFVFFLVVSSVGRGGVYEYTEAPTIDEL